MLFRILVFSLVLAVAVCQGLDLNVNIDVMANLGIMQSEERF